MHRDKSNNALIVVGSTTSRLSRLKCALAFLVTLVWRVPLGPTTHLCCLYVVSVALSYVCIKKHTYTVPIFFSHFMPSVKANINLIRQNFCENLSQRTNFYFHFPSKMVFRARIFTVLSCVQYSENRFFESPSRETLCMHHNVSSRMSPGDSPSLSPPFLEIVPKRQFYY